MDRELLQKELNQYLLQIFHSLNINEKNNIEQNETINFLDRYSENRDDLNTKPLATDELVNKCINLQKEINSNIDKQNNKNDNAAIQNMCSDLSYIWNKLKPLENIIDFEITIVGGALRDLIMGKSCEIKDLDLTVKVDLEKLNQFFLTNPTDSELNKFIQKIEAVICKDTLSQILIEANSNDLKQFFNKYYFNMESFTDNYKYTAKLREALLIGLLGGRDNFSKILSFEDLHLNNDENGMEYNTNGIFNDYLEGILKLDKEKTKNNYNIDLLMSSDFASLVTKFDVDLCKVSLNSKDLNLGSTNDYSENFYKHIKADRGFLISSIAKTFFIDTSLITKKGLHYSLNNRLKKFMAKYPEFGAFFIQTPDEFEIAEKIVIEKIFLENIKLERIINKTEKKNHRQNKI